MNSLILTGLPRVLELIEAELVDQRVALAVMEGVTRFFLDNPAATEARLFNYEEGSVERRAFEAIIEPEEFDSEIEPESSTRRSSRRSPTRALCRKRPGSFWTMSWQRAICPARGSHARLPSSKTGYEY